MTFKYLGMGEIENYFWAIKLQRLHLPRKCTCPTSPYIQQAKHRLKFAILILNRLYTGVSSSRLTVVFNNMPLRNPRYICLFLKYLSEL